MDHILFRFFASSFQNCRDYYHFFRWFKLQQLYFIQKVIKTELGVFKICKDNRILYISNDISQTFTKFTYKFSLGLTINELNIRISCIYKVKRDICAVFLSPVDFSKKKKTTKRFFRLIWNENQNNLYVPLENLLSKW